MNKEIILYKESPTGKSIIDILFKSGILKIGFEFEDIYPATEGRVIKLVDSPKRHWCLRLTAKALFWTIKKSITFLTN